MPARGEDLARLAWEIADLSDELAALFGRPVDPVAPRDVVLVDERPLRTA